MIDRHSGGLELISQLCMQYLPMAALLPPLMEAELVGRE